MNIISLDIFYKRRLVPDSPKRKTREGGRQQIKDVNKDSK